MKLLRYLSVCICFLIMLAVPVSAYVDPSVVTTAVQVIAGVVVVVGAVAGVAWRRAKRVLQQKLGVREGGKKEMEPDVLFFDDDDDELESAPVHRRYSMKISTETGSLFRAYDPEEGLEILAQAGFDCVDMTFCDMATNPEDIYLQPGADELCRKIRAKADALGLTFNQCHAPFSMDMQPWLKGDREHILHLLNTSIRLAGILGVKNVVVHPVQCMDYLNSDPAWVKQVNMEFYASLIPAAKEAGVKIAIENMWRNHQYNGHIVSSVCSSAYELRDYVDSCNAIEPIFTACLDIGHCLLTGHDPVNSIRVLGDRLGCLHVHDVDGVNDNHTCPMTLKVDFPAVVDALWEIGYQGEFTLEACGYVAGFAKKNMPHAIKHLADVCKMLTTP